MAPEIESSVPPEGLEAAAPDGSRPGRIVGSRWELFEQIAQGGMAAVYRGRHRVTGQSAAVKILAPTAAPNARKRFEEEVRIAASIGHPGVVQVFDAGVDESTGDAFLAMELLVGRTLGDCMDEHDERQLLLYIRRLLEPLAAAHDARVVHRDLKPDNVFVSDEPGDQIKLLDFGIARTEQSPQLTQVGSAVGTPGYMSPEQALGKEIGPAADVWAVGVMLYEILADVHPFAADSAHGVIVAACTRPHDSLRTFGVDAGLSLLVDRCLEKEAQRRPANAGLLLLELNRALGLASVAPSLRFSKPLVPSLEMPAGSMGAPTGGGSIHSLAAGRKSVIKALSGPVVATARGRSIHMLGGLGVVSLLFFAAWLTLPVSLLGTMIGLVAGITTAVVLGVAAASKGSPSRAQRPRPRRRRPPAKQEPGRATQPPPTRGPEQAPVGLVFVADLSCPTTRKAKGTLERLLRAYPETIRVVFRHAPSGLLGYQVCQAAVEAKVQGGNETFWRFIELLLRGYRRVTMERVEFLFGQLDLDVSQLRHALASQRHWLLVDDDRELAHTLGVRTVPGFLLEGRIFDRDTPMAVLADAVEAALQPAQTPDDIGTMVEDLAATAGREFDQVLVQWSALEGSQLSVVRSRAEARERADRLLMRAHGEGADFTKLAATFSDGMAYVASFEALPGAIQRHAARLRVGAVSTVIESEEGFHILRRRA